MALQINKKKKKKLYSPTSTNNVTALQMLSPKIYFLIHLSMELYVANLKPCRVVYYVHLFYICFVMKCFLHIIFSHLTEFTGKLVGKGKFLAHLAVSLGEICPSNLVEYLAQCYLA